MKPINYQRAAVAVALTFFAVGAYAGHHKGERESHIEVLTERLELTDAQVPEVEAILADAAAERKTIGDTYTLNQRAEAREAMRALHERTMQRMSGVLTAEQSEKLEKIHERRKHMREHRREDRREHRRMKQQEEEAG